MTEITFTYDLWFLQFFCSLFLLYNTKPWVWVCVCVCPGVWYKFLFWAEHFIVSYCQHIDLLWVSINCYLLQKYVSPNECCWELPWSISIKISIQESIHFFHLPMNVNNSLFYTLFFGIFSDLLATSPTTLAQLIYRLVHSTFGRTILGAGKMDQF